MPHSKAFDMINLQYEVGICHILYNKGTITNTLSNNMLRKWAPFAIPSFEKKCIIVQSTKGHLISKGLFKVFICTKKLTKIFL